MGLLESLIEKSGHLYLKKLEFNELTPGRFFSKRVIDFGNGWKHFFVVLGPNVESPIHNHSGQNMAETHYLIYGSGKFIVYGDNKPKLEIVLQKGRLHEIFSTPHFTPNHKYVAGPEGSITMAFEKHYG